MLQTLKQRCQRLTVRILFIVLSHSMVSLITSYDTGARSQCDLNKSVVTIKDLLEIHGKKHVRSCYDDNIVVILKESC